MSKREVALEEDKKKAREQWSEDPCGEIYGREFEFGTREFFDEVERYRYEEYAPWMPEVMGFNEFKGARLLEIGCGMGTDLLQFARGGARITGTDITPRSVEISRERFRLYSMPGDFVVTDGERLPFADESFDVAGFLRASGASSPSRTKALMSSIPTACFITRPERKRLSAKFTACCAPMGRPKSCFIIATLLLTGACWSCVTAYWAESFCAGARLPK